MSGQITYECKKCGSLRFGYVFERFDKKNKCRKCGCRELIPITESHGIERLNKISATKLKQSKLVITPTEIKIPEMETI